MRVKNKPLALDPYHTRRWKLDYQYRSDTIYSSTWLSYIAVVLFVAIDFACLNSSWTSVQNDSAEWLVKLISIGCSFCLDIPMAIAALAAKEFTQKLKGKRESLLIISLCIACFLIVWGFSFGFRISTRTSSFAESASTLVNTLDTSADSSTSDSGQTVFYAALFSAILPLCTSIASFVITYFSCDPLAKKIYRQKRIKIEDDANIVELNQALVEASDAEDYQNFLIAYEQDSLAAHNMRINAQGEHIKQIVRNEIMKKLNTPEQVAVIQESGVKLHENGDQDELPTNSIDYLLGKKEETQNEENS